MKQAKFFAAGLLVLGLILAACGSNPQVPQVPQVDPKHLVEIEISFDELLAIMETPIPDSDFIYELDSSGKGVVLKGYKGTAEFFTLPSTIEGLPVTEVLPIAYCTGLTLSGREFRYNFLSEGQVKKIRVLSISGNDTCFFDNDDGILVGVWENLELIIVKDSPHLWEVGYYRGQRYYGDIKVEDFRAQSLPQLRYLVMDDSIKENGGFQGLPSLESVIFSNNLESVRGFANCPKLKTVKLPRNLKTIGSSAFRNCVSLEHIDLPDTVTEIQEGAFAYTGLKNVIVPPNLEILGDEAFLGCEKLEQITLNSKLTELKIGTFGGCTSLKSITLPSNIRRVEAAFKGCSSLGEITFLGNLEESDFTGIGTITKLVIGSGVTRLNVKLNLPNMPLTEQVKLRELGIQSTHSGDMPYTIEYR
jgi:hypothetical protein